MAAPFFNHAPQTASMYPVHHAALSILVGLVTVPFIGLEPPAAVLAFLLALAAGVGIDVDHVLLPMLLKGRRRQGVAWLLRPVPAFTRPRDLLDALSYEQLVFHRLLSHSTVLVVLFLVSREIPVLVPAVAALAAHIVADVAWDLSRGTYRDRMVQRRSRRSEN